jgi:hypothetical protein
MPTFGMVTIDVVFWLLLVDEEGDLEDVSLALWNQMAQFWVCTSQSSLQQSPKPMAFEPLVVASSDPFQGFVVVLPDTLMCC